MRYLRRVTSVVSNPGQAAVDETVEALVFCAPLMKHEGFQEEREWRLIYVPHGTGAPLPLKFHPRRDFLAPFLNLKELWNSATPIPMGTRGSPPVNVPRPHGNPLIPITAITVGPSGHQDLNVRAMRKAVSHLSKTIPVTASSIPYRSLG